MQTSVTHFPRNLNNGEGKGYFSSPLVFVVFLKNIYILKDKRRREKSKHIYWIVVSPSLKKKTFVFVVQVFKKKKKGKYVKMSCYGHRMRGANGHETIL